MIVALVLIAAPALGACAPVAPSAWRAEIDVALQAWVRLDEGTFAAAVERVEVGSSCLAGPIAPEDAAAWHLLSAVSAWHRDPERPATVVDHLRAGLAVGLDPASNADLLPPGSPLDELVTVARAAPAVASPLPTRRPLALRVDGALVGEALGLPALVQLEGARGVLWSRALDTPWDAPVPRRRWLAPLTGVTAGVSVALWGSAVGTRLAWEQGGDEELWRPNQGLLISSAVLGGAAVGLGVATLVDALRARRAP